MDGLSRRGQGNRGTGDVYGAWPRDLGSRTQWPVRHHRPSRRVLVSRPMSYRLAILTVALLAIAAGDAGAQGVVTQRNLSLGMAKTVADAALAECKPKGFNTSVAVVDRAGQVLVILRD